MQAKIQVEDLFMGLNGKQDDGVFHSNQVRALQGRCGRRKIREKCKKSFYLSIQLTSMPTLQLPEASVWHSVGDIQNEGSANTYSVRNFKYSGIHFSTINNFLQFQCPNFVFKVKKKEKKRKRRNASTESYTLWFNVQVFLRLKHLTETHAETQML